MSSEGKRDSQEVSTFEEYTIYSLEQSMSGVLSIMERSKQVANLWPDVAALVEAADLCKELAALTSFLDSLDEVLGDVPGLPGEAWGLARAGLQSVMAQMSDAVSLNDEGTAVQLFGSTLPAMLHQFGQIIPALQEHVRETYQCAG